MGVGEAKDNIKTLEKAVEEMTIIAGQKPVITKAKKSVSNFKIREGMPGASPDRLRSLHTDCRPCGSDLADRLSRCAGCH